MLLEQKTIDGLANRIETWSNPLHIVPLGSNDSDLEYKRELGGLLVGHVQAEGQPGGPPLPRASSAAVGVLYHRHRRQS